MLGYVLPILTVAWPGKERGGEEAQNGLQFQGLLPPFFGGRKFAPPFFNFGPGGIALWIWPVPYY